MALLVTDQGEIDSLRTLLNSTHQIPRNLVLKLYTGPAAAPTEQDVPGLVSGDTENSDEKYFEPYDNSNTTGYGADPTTGYPFCVNNRTEEDQDFSNQTGILLNGNRWDITTTVNTVTTKQLSADATVNTYQIQVNNVADIKKGDYVEGPGGVATNTYVVDIQGTDIEVSQRLTATITAGTDVKFGRGRTTATYPEQVFTFDGAAGNVQGYYLSRATNLPVALQGVKDTGDAAAATTVRKTECKGVIGKNWLELKDVTVTESITSGAVGTFEIAIADNTNVEAGQRVSGTGIAANTVVIGKQGSNNVYLSKALTGAASGNAEFKVEVAKELQVGQVVSKYSHTSNQGPDGFAAGTKITGIDYNTVGTEQGPRVYLSENLIENVGVASDNDQVNFDFSVVTTTVDHKLNPGDVIYISRHLDGTTSVAPGHYTVFETPSGTTFTTTPALAGTGKCTLYPSIFFAEKFTNGPYAIQNDGDQIKVTLNVSLD